MAEANECCTTPPPSEGATEEKEGMGLFSKIVNCILDLCLEPAKELCVSIRDARGNNGMYARVQYIQKTSFWRGILDSVQFPWNTLCMKSSQECDDLNGRHIRHQ